MTGPGDDDEGGAGDDRALWERAQADAVPLPGKHRRRAAADKTVTAAPGGGASGGGAERSAVRVERTRDGDVEGLREGASRALLKELRGRGFRAERTLDLHGMRGDEAVKALEGFVRQHREWGARSVLIVHGKGLHSADGVGVLRDAVVDALGSGKLAVEVLGFATAHGSLGGRGALAVRLR